MQQVDYVDSTGLGALVMTYTTLNKAGGKIKLLNLTRRSIELLVMTKLTTIFEVFDDEQNAVNSFFPDREIKRFDILNFVQQYEGRVSLNPARLLRHAAASIYTRFMASARENETLAAGQRAPISGSAGLENGEHTLGELLKIRTGFPRVSSRFPVPPASSRFRFSSASTAAWGMSSATRMFTVSQDDAEATREFQSRVRHHHADVAR